MNRADLQRLSNTRIREAKVLFKSREYSGAYYLAGYAVECALKARFAKLVRRYDFPDKSTGKVFTHRLSELIKLAGLENALIEERQSDSVFDASWNRLLEWNEESRYATWSRDEAENILRAIVRRKGGVLPWIKRYW